MYHTLYPDAGAKAYRSILVLTGSMIQIVYVIYEIPNEILVGNIMEVRY